MTNFDRTLKLCMKAEDQFPGILEEMEQIQKLRHQTENEKLKTEKKKVLQQAKKDGFVNGILSVFGLRPKPYQSMFDQTSLSQTNGLEKDIHMILTDLEQALHNKGSSIQQLQQQ